MCAKLFLVLLLALCVCFAQGEIRLSDAITEDKDIASNRIPCDETNNGEAAVCNDPINKPVITAKLEEQENTENDSGSQPTRWQLKDENIALIGAVIIILTRLYMDEDKTPDRDHPIGNPNACQGSH